MSFVYLEYRSRNAGVEQAHYHQVIGRKTATWEDIAPDDQLIWNVGRSWRFGPDYDYLMAFHCPNHGLERLSDWAALVENNEDVQRMFAHSRLVGRIDLAGAYRTLREPIKAADAGPYYAEFFDFTGSASDVAAYYEERANGHPDFVLHMLLDRIGVLGPDPRGVAVWGIPNYGDMSRLVDDIDDEAPISLKSSGLYADVGKEIL